MDIKPQRLLANIRLKCMGYEYQNHEQFQADVKAFYDTYRMDKVMRPLVVTFKNHIIKDLSEAKKCFSCVSNYYSSEFSAICKEPHVLVWAKYLTEPFWPAKVYMIDEVGRKVTVKFFGEKHETAQITLNGSNAYLVTGKRYPKYFEAKKKMPSKRKSELLYAMEELSEHLDQIREFFPEKELFNSSKELIQYDATYLYLKDRDIDTGHRQNHTKMMDNDNVHVQDVEEDVVEMASDDKDLEEGDAEPDSKLDKTTFKGLDALEAIKRDPDYQPSVVVDNVTDYVILKKSDLLLDSFPIDFIADLQAKTWDADEYEEDKNFTDADFDRDPGVNVSTIDANHETLMNKYLSPAAERRQRSRHEIRKRLIAEREELIKKLKVQREYSARELKLKIKESKDRIDKEMKIIEDERRRFMSTLVPDEMGHVDNESIKKLMAQHAVEINEMKRTPTCRVCYKDAVRVFSDEGPFCSIKCVKLGLE